MPEYPFNDKERQTCAIQTCSQNHYQVAIL